MSDLLLSLGWVEDTETMEKEDFGVICHEFGHTLGLLHEHQSLVRDKTLTFNEEAVYEYFGGPPNNWSRAQVKRQILDVYAKQDVSNYSKMDVRNVPRMITTCTYTINSSLLSWSTTSLLS